MVIRKRPAKYIHFGYNTIRSLSLENIMNSFREIIEKKKLNKIMLECKLKQEGEILRIFLLDMMGKAEDEQEEIRFSKAIRARYNSSGGSSDGLRMNVTTHERDDEYKYLSLGYVPLGVLFEPDEDFFSDGTIPFWCDSYLLGSFCPRYVLVRAVQKAILRIRPNSHGFMTSTGRCICGSVVINTSNFSEEECWNGASEGLVCKTSGTELIPLSQ
jgi:hypothetical protein